MGKLGGEMKALSKKAGGSFKTVDDRIHIMQRFSRHLRTLNIQIQRVEQIRVRHIECYIQTRLAQEIGKRTLQNEMAALRGVLQQAGRKQVAEHERLTNKSLGVAGASRNGTNRAITPEYYQRVLAAARERRGAGSNAGAGKADGVTFAGDGTMLSVTERVEKGAGARRNQADGGFWHQRLPSTQNVLFRML
jgi:hypothetical protein